MTDWKALQDTLSPWVQDGPRHANVELPLKMTVKPESDDALQNVLAIAENHQSVLYPVGGGTSLDYGCPAQSDGLGILMTDLNEIVDYPAKDMTITVGAGITMSKLSKILLNEQQQLPIDVPSPEYATLGGVLVTNTCGPGRYGYGTIRDYVIGLNAMDASGNAFQSGGRVVKNVAGYDLCKLLIGSLGTLGIVYRVTLKVRPLVETTVLTCLSLGGQLLRFDSVIDQLTQTVTRPVAIELLDSQAKQLLSQKSGCLLPEEGYSLLLGFEGTEETVAWQQDQLQSELQILPEQITSFTGEDRNRLWQSLSEFMSLEAPLTLKANVPSSKVCSLIEPLTRHGFSIQSHVGNGIVIGKHTDLDNAQSAEAIIQPIRRSAVEMGGNLIILRCPTNWKQTIPVWGHSRQDEDIMRLIKNKFDPRNVLNPDRFIGNI